MRLSEKMSKEEMQMFRNLFNKYCKQEISIGHCETGSCDSCSINNAYDEIFNYFADQEEDDEG